MFGRIQTSKVHTFDQQTLKYSKYNVWSNSGIKDEERLHPDIEAIMYKNPVTYSFHA